MPKQIVIEFTKKELESLLLEASKHNIECQSPNGSTFSVDFTDEEVEVVRKMVEGNEAFEKIRLEFPGTVDLSLILTEELVEEKVPNIKIKVQEKESSNQGFLEYF